MKTLFLKLIIFLFAIIWISSCDQTRFRTKGNQLFGNNPYLATTNYTSKEVPEGYAEIQIDSILANNFVINTKYHTTDDKILKVEKNKLGDIHKTVYKEFHSDLSVYYKNNLVLKKRVEKDTFNIKENPILEAAFMQSFKLNEIASTTNQIVFSVTFYNPSAENYIDYEFVVDKIGDYYIRKV